MSRRAIGALAALFALTALLAPRAAPAYELLTRDFGSGEIPIRWLFTGGAIEYVHNPQRAPGNIDAPALVDEAFATWTGVPSAAIAFSRGTDTASAGFDFGDGENVVSYDDPGNDLETGVLAAAVSWVPDDTTHGWQSATFYEITQADIVFNDGVSFTDSDGASILGGCIAGRFDIEAVALHEVGHLFGLAHPVQSTPTYDYDLTIMFPSIDDCDPTRTSPKADDVDAITYLYDSGVPPVYPAFAVDDDEGYAPFTVAFTDQTTGTVTSRSWDFGDGGTSSATNPTHEYQTPGAYDVTLTVNGTASLEQVNAVVVYARPDVDFAASEVSGDPPLTVAFENLTTDEGSEPRFRWDFGDGETSTLREPTHVYRDPGRYTVRLEVDAGAGYVEHEKEDLIHVKGAPEEELFPGCSCRVASSRGGGLSTGVLLASLACALALRSRRNRQ